MDVSQRQDLVAAALDVRQRAFCPHPDFPVGAALLAHDGHVFVGLNVENDWNGLTMCVERAAVGSAVSSGRRAFKALAAASAGGVTSCGACRQVLAQFGDRLQILLVDADGPESPWKIGLAELLPHAFAHCRR
jgi:cytidine deaminase